MLVVIPYTSQNSISITKTNLKKQHYFVLYMNSDDNNILHTLI